MWGAGRTYPKSDLISKNENSTESGAFPYKNPVEKFRGRGSRKGIRNEIKTHLKTRLRNNTKIDLKIPIGNSIDELKYIM